MDEKQQKNIVRDVINGTVGGAVTVLSLETAIFPENRKLSMIGRDTFIGGLIGGAVGFVVGLIYHGRSKSKTERLAPEKAVSDVNKDTARTL